MTCNRVLYNASCDGSVVGVRIFGLSLVKEQQRTQNASGGHPGQNGGHSQEILGAWGTTWESGCTCGNPVETQWDSAEIREM